jgi:hypothetical protein
VWSDFFSRWDVHDPASRPVSGGLSVSVLLAYLPGLVGLEPLLELLGGHVGDLVEVRYDLLFVLPHGNLLHFVRGVGFVGGLFAALLALDEVARVVLRSVDLLPAAFRGRRELVRSCLQNAAKLPKPVNVSSAGCSWLS